MKNTSPLNLNLTDDLDLPGYQKYPVSEDIYENAIKIGDVDEEGIVHQGLSPDPETWNEVSDLSGDDLDVPGSELDDEMEEIGSEDEENNYYSIGGDNHADLEETKDE